MATPKNCVFCTTTNRLIDFIPDGLDGQAAITKLTPEYGTALIILPRRTMVRRGSGSVEVPSTSASAVTVATGERHCLTPSHTRYATPSHLISVNVRLDAAISAPRPSATTRICVQMPSTRPSVMK